jgi:hypothetical protein
MPVQPISLRRTLYAPLLLSLPISLPLTGAAIIAGAFGWLPIGLPFATGDTRWADALALIPQTFVVCVCACWLLTAVSLPFSRRWPENTQRFDS